MRTIYIVLLLSLVQFPLAMAQFTYSQVTTGLGDVYESGNSIFTLGDIDHDGDIDILSVGDHYSPLIPEEMGLMVFRNQGNGSAWSKTMSGDFGYGGVAMGDVNNDGWWDVAYGVHHNYANEDFGDQVLEVVLGNGTCTNWVPYDDNLGMQGQTWGMFGCDFADVNNDGLLDLGANSFGCCDGVWIYKNNGDGSWTTWAGALDLNSSMQFRFGDFDRDGMADFIASNTQFNNQVGQVWKNTGNGNFSLLQSGLPFSDYGYKFDIGDVNNDGADDIATSFGGFPRVYTYDIITNTWISISSGLPVTSQSLLHLALGDMDGDGYQDLVTFKSGLITVYKGDGGSSWTQVATLTIAETTCSDIKLGDLDHNGYRDIVYWGKYNGSNMLRVFLNMTPVLEPAIIPVYPLGGEFYCHGTAQFIEWNTAILTGDTGTINLEYSTTGPLGPFFPIAQNLPNSGLFQWSIPGVSSVSCHLRFTLNIGTASYQLVTTQPFSIDTCGSVPVIPGVISGAAQVCADQPVTYSVPATPNANGYVWSLPSGWNGTSNTNVINAIAGTNGGMISVYATSASGNSISQTLSVSVITIDTAVTQNGITLSAVETADSYQWMDCLSGSIILGEVNQNFTPVSDGSFAVILSIQSCTDTSSCYPVIVSSTSGNIAQPRISLSPNPVHSVLRISSSLVIDNLRLYDIPGMLIREYRIVDNNYLLDLSGIPAGMYYIHISSGDRMFSRKIIHVTK